MLDLKLIRANPENLDQSLAKRGKEPVAKRLLELDAQYRQSLTDLQELQTERNQLAKQFGEAKRQGHDTTDLANRAEQVKQKVALLEQQNATFQEQLHAEVASLPNLVAVDVPIGQDETQNVEIRRNGIPPAFNYPAQAHFDL